VSSFNINLISANVLPRGRRAIVFWAMAAYVTGCGVVLALIAYRTTCSLMQVSETRAAIQRSEMEFERLYPAGGDIEACMEQLKSQLDLEYARLSVIDGILKRRANISVILSALSGGLPADLHILNVGLDKGETKLMFDLVIPVGNSVGNPNASELIAHWTANKSLMREVSAIRSLVTERQLIEGRPVFLLKFECQLQKGEA